MLVRGPTRNGARRDTCGCEGDACWCERAACRCTRGRRRCGAMLAGARTTLACARVTLAVRARSLLVRARPLSVQARTVLVRTRRLLVRARSSLVRELDSGARDAGWCPAWTSQGDAPMPDRLIRSAGPGCNESSCAPASPANQPACVTTFAPTEFSVAPAHLGMTPGRSIAPTRVPRVAPPRRSRANKYQPRTRRLVGTSPSGFAPVRLVSTIPCPLAPRAVSLHQQVSASHQRASPRTDRYRGLAPGRLLGTSPCRPRTTRVSLHQQVPASHQQLSGLAPRGVSLAPTSVGPRTAGVSLAPTSVGPRTTGVSLAPTSVRPRTSRRLLAPASVSTRTIPRRRTIASRPYSRSPSVTIVFPEMNVTYCLLSTR